MKNFVRYAVVTNGLAFYYGFALIVKFIGEAVGKAEILNCVRSEHFFILAEQSKIGISRWWEDGTR
jgi:hypothetical protein